MSSGRRVRVGVLAGLLAAGPVAAVPQVLPSPSPKTEINAEEERLYADARPYMDEPLSELKKTVHELEGVEPVADQSHLSELLLKVGAKADELLHKVPNLISDEVVSQTQWAASHNEAPGCVGFGCGKPHDLQQDREFNYIILSHPAEDRRQLLEEYRTTRNDKPVQGAGAPHFQGFASAWVVFSSSNQVESRFRYLGQQKTDGHDTFVVGFAQIPGSIDYPGKIVTSRGSIPMLLQGVAWIDQADFRIVRLRTDLLAPQPEIGFQEQTSNIQFGSVRIAVLDSELWLPQEVVVVMQANGQFLREHHRYSKYRLYQAKSKIILSPEN